MRAFVCHQFSDCSTVSGTDGDQYTLICSKDLYSIATSCSVGQQCYGMLHIYMMDSKDPFRAATSCIVGKWRALTCGAG